MPITAPEKTTQSEVAEETQTVVSAERQTIVHCKMRFYSTSISFWRTIKAI